MSEEYNGYDIEIEQDYYAVNPRQSDNIGTLALFHNRYTLDNESGLDSADYSSWSDVKAAIRKAGAVLVLPVYGYDHSGLFLSTRVEPTWWHYSWDGGQLGFIYATRDSLKKIMGWKKLTQRRLDQVKEWLETEVKMYAQWMVGDVWEYTISQDGEVVESCGEWYGHDECSKAAQEYINDYLSKEEAVGEPA